MERQYLGETEVTNLQNTPFANYETEDWILYFIGEYGWCDGSHHKHEVLDQVARIACGTELKVVVAKWDDGHSEYRVYLEEPTEEYEEWCNTYEWLSEEGW